MLAAEQPAEAPAAAQIHAVEICAFQLPQAFHRFIFDWRARRRSGDARRGDRRRSRLWSPGASGAQRRALRRGSRPVQAEGLGQPLQQVIKILEQSDAFLRPRNPNNRGEPLYTTKDKYKSDSSLGRRILDAVANTVTEWDIQFTLGDKHMNMLGLVAIASVGGFVLNMMNLYDGSKKPKSERLPKHFLYLIFFAFWPLAGAGLALLYALDGSMLRPLLWFPSV
jgi:hypothetical protein